MKKLLQLLFFIPLSLLGYYAFLLIGGFINNVFMTDNYFVEKYIVPIIANFIGIFVYFQIGKYLMPEFEKKIYTKIAYFLLGCSLISKSSYFLYFSIMGEEYYKAVINTINILISIIVLFAVIKDESYID